MFIHRKLTCSELVELLTFSHSGSPSAVFLRGRTGFLAAALFINTVYGSLEYNAMEYYTNNVMPRAIYTKDHNAIVERLKKARIEAGLGQVEVAKKLGKTQSYLSKIESGQRRFDVLQLKEFAKIYKKPLDFFVK